MSLILLYSQPTLGFSWPRNWLPPLPPLPAVRDRAFAWFKQPANRFLNLQALIRVLFRFDCPLIKGSSVQTLECIFVLNLWAIFDKVR